MSDGKDIKGEPYKLWGYRSNQELRHNYFFGVASKDSVVTGCYSPLYIHSTNIMYYRTDQSTNTSEEEHQRSMC